MFSKEKELVTEDFCKLRTNYNCGPGGIGGPQFKGRKHSESTKKKISKAATGKKFKKTKEQIQKSNDTKLTKNNGEYVSEETRQKMSLAAKNRFISIETKNKISNSLKKYYAENENISIKMPKSEEHKCAIAKTMKEKYADIFRNLIWIKNVETGECIRIPSGLFGKYQQNGFVKGRILKK